MSPSGFWSSAPRGRLFLKGVPVSLSMAVLGLGFALSRPLQVKHPLLDHSAGIEHIINIALVVSVIGAGLRLDRPFSRQAWGGIWRLLAFTMPLSIVGIAATAS